jgi:hypothetical protein
MNREDVIRMAREAQMPFYWRTGEITYLDKLERFAALVASHALVEPCCGNYDQCQKVCMPRAAFAEREACAGLRKEVALQGKHATEYEEGFWDGLQKYEDLIRARNQT